MTTPEPTGTTSRGTTPSAPPSVIALDGISLQRLQPEHASIVSTLLQLRGHRHILDIPVDEGTIATLLRDLPTQPWSLPLAVVRDNECIGVATTALADVKALSASFMTMFVEPGEATIALAMAVRHLFWSFPLHRIHVQVPDMDLTVEYVDLLTSVGFQVEGRLVDHLRTAGRSFDMVALGLLRREFDDWCDEHEPRLSLR